MSIELSQGANSERFVARRYMLVPLGATGDDYATADPGNPWAMVFLSGVAIVNLQGRGGDWRREDLSLDLEIDYQHALAQQPGASIEHATGGNAALNVRSWTVFVTVNSHYAATGGTNFDVNIGPVTVDSAHNHTGVAVDDFALPDRSQPYKIAATLAVRDSNAWLYRVGYQVTLYGQLS